MIDLDGIAIIERIARVGNCYQIAQKTHHLWAEVTGGGQKPLPIPGNVPLKNRISVSRPDHELCFKKELSHPP